MGARSSSSGSSGGGSRSSSSRKKREYASEPGGYGEDRGARGSTRTGTVRRSGSVTRSTAPPTRPSGYRAENGRTVRVGTTSPSEHARSAGGGSRNPISGRTTYTPRSSRSTSTSSRTTSASPVISRPASSPRRPGPGEGRTSAPTHRETHRELVRTRTAYTAINRDRPSNYRNNNEYMSRYREALQQYRSAQDAHRNAVRQASKSSSRAGRSTSTGRSTGTGQRSPAPPRTGSTGQRTITDGPGAWTRGWKGRIAESVRQANNQRQGGGHHRRLSGDPTGNLQTGDVPPPATSHTDGPDHHEKR